MSAIDAVVFDLGNVLVRWDPVLAHTGELRPEEVAAVHAEIDFDALNRRADSGHPWSDLEAEVAAAWPEHAGFLGRYLARFPSTLAGPVRGAAELVADVRSAGLRTLGCSNWSQETFPHAMPAAPVIATLEAVVLSGAVGVAKPDRAIFEHLVRTHALTPHRTAFLDDSAENVAAAAELGLRVVLFRTAEQARADLVTMGVPIPPARAGLHHRPPRLSG